MHELIIRKTSDELIKYRLYKSSISIGRASENDISLPDPKISRVHLVLQQRGEDWIATDQSSNGSFLNGKRISSEILSPGDQLKLGVWKIEFRQIPEQKEEQAETQIIQSVPTQIISYRVQDRSIMLHEAQLHYPEQHKAIDLKGALFTIGSSEGNDLVIDSPFVSSYHCKIEFKNNAYFIKDLDSTNGIFVNEKQVVEAALEDGNQIRVGQSSLEFSCHRSSETLEEFTSHQFEGMFSRNEKMQQNFALAQRIAQSDAYVLIEGPTGSGKELMARAIHNCSHRKLKPYLTLNCGAIAKELIESELFGHERGAFTSAHQLRKGIFEAAHGGTVFLDELGELPIELQPKLLRVLENSEIKRVGGNQNIHVDVRIVAATHKNLPEEVSKGNFREDLFYRLYMVPICLPSLAERKEDIADLTDIFLEQMSQNENRSYSINPSAKQKLTQHDWPGNIRELKNVLQRAALSSNDGNIGPQHISFPPRNIEKQTNFEHKLASSTAYEASLSLRDVEKNKILEELNNHDWNKKETAGVLGIAKSTLHEKIKKYGLDKLDPNKSSLQE